MGSLDELQEARRVIEEMNALLAQLNQYMDTLEGEFDPTIPNGGVSLGAEKLDAENRPDAREKLEVGEQRDTVIEKIPTSTNDLEAPLTHLDGVVTFLAPGEDGESVAPGDCVRVTVTDVADNYAHGVIDDD